MTQSRGAWLPRHLRCLFTVIRAPGAPALTTPRGTKFHPNYRLAHSLIRAYLSALSTRRVNARYYSNRVTGQWNIAKLISNQYKIAGSGAKQWSVTQT